MAQHTFIAPVAMTPEQHEHFDRSVLEAKPGIYISFAAGRRGAGSVSCQFCGVPLVVRDGSAVWPDLGELDQMAPAKRKLVEDAADACKGHDAGLEVGPIFGPFEYVENTYQWMRVDDGEHLAVWNNKLGDWVIVDDGPFSGSSYSDITIAHYAPKRGIRESPSQWPHLKHFEVEAIFHVDAEDADKAVNYLHELLDNTDQPLSYETLEGAATEVTP